MCKHVIYLTAVLLYTQRDTRSGVKNHDFVTTKMGVKKRREKGWPKSAAGGEGRVLTRMHRSSQREQLKKDLGVVQPKALERDGQKEPRVGGVEKNLSWQV